MKPLYTHDCDKCIFLGTWRKNPDCDNQQDFDLYVCQSLTNLPSTNCLARFSNDGPDYASMTLENSVWDESLAAHDARKDRPSMYLCWMPELLECWRRWKDKQWKAAYLDHFSVGSAGVPAQRMESEERERMHTFHPNPGLPTPTDAQLEQMKAYQDHFMQGTITSRISYAEPNMANIPVKDEEGARIRSKFSPNFPMQSVESDAVSRYTQALRNGSDPHKMMAAAVFGKAEGEVTPEEREEVKDVNFFAAYAIHDQVEFKTATGRIQCAEPNVVSPGGTITGRMMPSKPEMQFFPPQGEKATRPTAHNAPTMDIDYAELELRLLTADGYTFKVHADGSIGDGDLSWPNLQYFIDSYKKMPG